METTRSFSREEFNRNCEQTLTLLRSTKPEAADLMLNMLNESILKRYGDSKQAIDISKFSKLKSEKSDIIKVHNKKPKLRKIKNEKSNQLSKNETNLNGSPTSLNNQYINKTTKQNSKKFNNKIQKHNKTKITKDEKNIRYKNNCFEKERFPSDEYDEEKISTSLTLPKNKNLNNKTKSNVITKLNENNENSDDTQDSKIHETQNTENQLLKVENEPFGTPPTIKRAQLQQKYTAKVKSHKKLPLHELSSRQRIQAVLEKGINNK